MVKTTKRQALAQSEFNPSNGIDCACVIHGDSYSWVYVERLWSMLNRNLSFPVRLHVWTEKNRPVPAPFIKHELVDWQGISGPKKAWWYKMQMFDTRNFQGQLLYFDLDVAIVDNIDWIVYSDRKYFCCLRDFKYLWRPNWNGINSSVMFWDTARFSYIWNAFSQSDPLEISGEFPGDQDFLTSVLPLDDRRFFNEEYIKSWRWQIFDGGLDIKNRRPYRPGAGAVLSKNTKIIVFHGRPKPHEIVDPVIQQSWS